MANFGQDPNTGLWTPDSVRDLHMYDDVNSSPDAHHHRLGVGPNDAFQGSRGQTLEAAVLDADSNIAAINTAIASLNTAVGLRAFQSDLNVTNATLNNLQPIGAVTMWAGTTILPPQWWLCHGGPLNRTTPGSGKELFDVIGTQYGVGDGVNTFNVPNMRARFPIGVSPTGTVVPAPGSYETNVDGSVTPGLGDETRLNHRHTHAVDSHNHSIAAQAADPSPQSPGTSAGAVPRNTQYGGHAHGGTTGNTAPGTDAQGVGGTGGNIQYHAFMTFYFIIRYR